MLGLRPSPGNGGRRHFALLGELPGGWRERRRLQQDLERPLTTSPHLIGDIGPSIDEALLEIATPVWQSRSSISVHSRHSRRSTA